MAVMKSSVSVKENLVSRVAFHLVHTVPPGMAAP